MPAQAKSEHKPFSPLVLCDRLLSLAQDADKAGFQEMANQLLALAHNACEKPEMLRSRRTRRSEISVASIQEHS